MKSNNDLMDDDFEPPTHNKTESELMIKNKELYVKNCALEISLIKVIRLYDKVRNELYRKTNVAYPEVSFNDWKKEINENNT